jgi:tetratricopeptide (TPR) repeat protein
MYVRGHRTDAVGYIYSIRLANRVGQQEIAREGLQRLSRLPEQAGVAVALRAELLGKQKGADEIVEQIEKTRLDLDTPANAPALSIYVEKLGELGRHADGRESTGKALELHPESPVFHEIYARVLRAADAPVPQVRAAYQKAIDLDPENDRALAGLAALEAKDGNDAVALSLYERADATDPEEPDSGIAAFELVRSSATPQELEARLVDLLRRYPHSAWAAGELAIVVVAEGKDMARALDLARRAGKFGASPYEDARRALRTVEASGVSPQADEAAVLIARLDESAAE